MSCRRRRHEYRFEFEGRIRKSKVTGTTKIIVDNSWVVSHSSGLRPNFSTHMNVELCISRVGSIKYLFKYLCKGSDRVTVEILRGSKDEQSVNNSKSVPTIGEIRNYQNVRYISASEAAWRLFSFSMVGHEPSV